MPLTMLDWRGTTELEPVLDRIISHLRDGATVVLPTEGGYTLARRLNEMPAAMPGDGPSPETIWVPRAGETDGPFHFDQLPSAAQRLLRRCWPGPLVIGLPREWWNTSVLGTLPASVAEVWFASPYHEVFFQLRQRLPFSLVLREITAPTSTSAADAPIPCSEWIAPLAEQVSLVLDDGPVVSSTPPTWLRLTAEGWNVFRPGEYRFEELVRLAAMWIIFVCTGNTCRSPLAEHLLKRRLADRLGCSVEELPAKGYWILSAGVAAFGGGPASAHAIAVAQEFGADLSSHRSRLVHPGLLREADLLYALAQSHQQAIQEILPDLPRPVELLAGAEGDIPDPYGGSIDDYRQCAQSIARHIDRILSEIRPI